MKKILSLLVSLFAFSPIISMEPNLVLSAPQDQDASYITANIVFVAGVISVAALCIRQMIHVRKDYLNDCIWACKNGNIREVKLLRVAVFDNYGSDVCDTYGWNLLHHACLGDNAGLIKYLLQSDVKPEAVSRGYYKGFNPLHMAVFNGKGNSVEGLIKSLGSSVDVPIGKGDFAGKYPLHLAAYRGYSNIILQLFVHIALPNIQDAQGNTALHLALRKIEDENFNERIQVVAALLLFTSPEIKNNDNLKPSELVPTIDKLNDAHKAALSRLLNGQRSDLVAAERKAFFAKFSQAQGVKLSRLLIDRNILGRRF